MVRRYKPTLMDYVVIAINPALIMVLIGSLIYFLLEMFYQGQYPERLHFCLTLFIFAAVLIARISMEEGWDHAAPLGAALAVAIMLAMHKFVSYEGHSYEAIGWIINYVLIGLTWWCAIQLTWDCTLIDETQDASGEGLLQTAGLDSDASATEKPDDEPKTIDPPEEEPNGDQKNAAASQTKLKNPSDQDFNDDMSWSTQKKPPKKSTDAKNKKPPKEKSWWDRFLERRRRPHAPGVWIVYFSLAALPIFGFGQAFIPVTNTGSRRYAFVLLCVYVATALGLLMTTSFLGLRRYLRQRRLEMPAAMAGTWLVTGTALIVALLVLTMLIPRTNAEYAISQLPIAAGSAEHGSSQLALGKEGTRDQQAKTGSGHRSRPENENPNDQQKENGSGEDTSHLSKSGGATATQSKGGNGQPNNEKGGESKPGDSQNDNNTAESKNDQSGSSQKESGDQKSSDSQSNASQSADSRDKSQAESDQSQAKNSQAQNESEQSQSESSQPSSTPTPPDLSGLSEGFTAILKWVFYGVLVCIALWWSWTHRHQLLAWLVAFLTGWRDLWGLFERKSTNCKAVAPPPPRHRSFHDYPDPFASGAAGQYPPAELIRYSFEALEAWARDQGWPRETDQTAYEFARQVGTHVAEVAKPARALADLYSRAAYAPGSLPAASVEQLRTLWQAMRERQPVGI